MSIREQHCKQKLQYQHIPQKIQCNATEDQMLQGHKITFDSEKKHKKKQQQQCRDQKAKRLSKQEQCVWHLARCG